jgi:hypothetical protein
MIICLKSKITLFLTCSLTLASGFVHAEAITSCDRSAALLADPQRKSEPVPFEKIDATTVIHECTEAIKMDPDNSGRFFLQRARGHLRMGNIENSLSDLNLSIEQNYFFGLGVAFLLGDVVEADYKEASLLLLKAYDKGVFWAANALAHLYGDENSIYYDLEKSEVWAQKFILEKRVASQK